MIADDAPETAPGAEVEHRMDGIPMREATIRLNMTANAIRKRIRRGTMQGYQVESQWFVILPDDDDDTEPTIAAQDGAERPDPRDRLINHLEREITFLRGELERRGSDADDWKRQAEHMTEMARLFHERAVRAEDALALPAGEPAGAPEPQPEPAPRSFWQRLFGH